MTNALVFDLETTTGIYNKRKASPFDPKNWVVAAGYKKGDGKTFINYFADYQGYLHHIVPLEEVHTLVGFNIKFDLLYCWDKREVKDFFRRGGAIWDCQYVHYLLQGQRPSAHMVSMDSIIESYGGDLKFDEVKALWNEGIDIPDINEDLLCDYLERDVDNTALMYEAQVQACLKLHPKFIHMVRLRMNGLLATTEMEYNGMTIDTEQGEEDRLVLQTELTKLQGELNDQLPALPVGLEFNWQSVYHRSYLIYGGTAKYKTWMPHLTEEGTQAYAQKTEKWPLCIATGDIGGETFPIEPEVLANSPDLYTQVRYLSGKRQGELKYRNVKSDDKDKPKGAQQEQTHSFNGLAVPRTEWKSSLTDALDQPIYSTNADIIDYLGSHTDIPFLKSLARGQSLSKDIGTYYWSEDAKGKRKGMLTLVGADGRIHHKLNHTSTVTGRLSSSDPNMQNIPRGDKSLAKRMFVSRFGSSGRLIEIDYSQLEVIVQGVLSRDRQLCADIREGVDFHVKRLSVATGRNYADLKRLHRAGDPDVLAERTKIKGFTFQRAYGAGPAAISASTGLSVDAVKDLIAAEDKLYPGLGKFDAEVEASIRSTTKVMKDEPLYFKDGTRHLAKTGRWVCPTGTQYIWRTHEAQDWQKECGTLTSFSPTERKNWPVQGFGGEIVQTMIGKLWQWFVAKQNFNGGAYLVNTVHDCVLIDVKEELVDVVVPTACKILEAVPHYFNSTFNMKIDVPFPVSAEVGHNWYEMKEYHNGQT